MNGEGTKIFFLLILPYHIRKYKNRDVKCILQPIFHSHFTTIRIYNATHYAAIKNYIMVHYCQSCILAQLFQLIILNNTIMVLEIQFQKITVIMKYIINLIVNGKHIFSVINGEI